MLGGLSEFSLASVPLTCCQRYSHPGNISPHPCAHAHTHMMITHTHTHNAWMVTHTQDFHTVLYVLFLLVGQMSFEPGKKLPWAWLGHRVHTADAAGPSHSTDRTSPPKQCLGPGASSVRVGSHGGSLALMDPNEHGPCVGQPPLSSTGHYAGTRVLSVHTGRGREDCPRGRAQEGRSTGLCSSPGILASDRHVCPPDLGIRIQPFL